MRTQRGWGILKKKHGVRILHPLNLIQESEGKKGIEGNWPCKDEEETRGTLPGERIKEESYGMGQRPCGQGGARGDGQRPCRARRSQRGWTEALPGKEELWDMAEALCLGTIMELGGGYE